jgi:hypothetical protein
MSNESSKKGRPKKPDYQKRSEVLKCYATQKQAMQIEEKANEWGMDVSNYLRAVALQEDIKTKYGQAELKKIKGQLGGIYGCVNQIAKKVNQGEPLEETTATLEINLDGEVKSREMNFGELMIYLHNTIDRL